MKNFSKFMAIVMSMLLVFSCIAIADDNAETVIGSADTATDILLVASDAASDADLSVDSDVASDSDEAILSDAEEDEETKEDVEADADITSDADVESDADVASDADEEITSDAEEEEAPSAPEAPSSFADLASDDWAYASIMNLVGKNVVSGDAVGTIRPDDQITREEVAKIMVVARGYEVEEAQITAPDAATVSDWAKGYFGTAIAKGIIKGDEDGSVRANDAVTRAELATIIVRALNANIDGFEASSFTDIKADDWYAKYVECAKTLNIVTGYGDGSFMGENAVTRREAFVMAERMVNLLDALKAN